MKLGAVTKLDKKNKATANCEVIVIFPIYGQFGAIQKPNSGRIVCKIYIFINNNLTNLIMLQKLKAELKNLSIALTLLL